MKVNLSRTEDGIFLTWDIKFSRRHSCVHWVLLENKDMVSAAMSFGYPDDLPKPGMREAREFLIEEIETFGLNDDHPSIESEELSESLQNIIKGNTQ